MSKAPKVPDDLRGLSMPADEFDRAMRGALQVPPEPDEKPKAKPTHSAAKRSPKGKKTRR